MTGQQTLIEADKTHKHPRRKIVRCMHEVETRGGSRGFEYELDCGHTVIRTGAAPSVKAVDCTTCPRVPRKARRAKAAQAPVPQGPHPFIRYPGGKGWLVDTIRAHLPPAWAAPSEATGRYFEPFCGGGALFFALRPKRGVLSDANAELVDCYRAIRDGVESVIEMLKYFQEDYLRLGAECYYRVRDEFVPCSAHGRAARTIFLNKTGFNGLYRVNSAGHFNVPHGRTASGKPPVICDAENLRACSAALQDVDLHCANALVEASRPPIAGDLEYRDPPYCGTWTGYTAGGFGDEHQRREAARFREHAERGVYVLASNADTPLVRELYHDFRLVELNGTKGRPNTMSAKASSRGEKKAELLIVGWQ